MTPTTTAPTTDPLPAEPRDPAEDRLHPADIIRSEATKLSSVRSTMWTLFATIGITVGLGSLFCAAFLSRHAHLDNAEIAGFDPTTRSLRGIFLAQLAVGVLGVLTITNEYATGMIRNTFAAVPQRRAVLAAKALVFGVVSLIVGEIASFGAFFAGQAILSQQNFEAHLGDPGVLRAVAGGGLYLTGVGLLGLGLGALLRRTAGAISTLFGLVLVLPLLAEALPSPWNTDVAKVLPGTAGQAMLFVRHQSDSLSPGAGLALFCAYIVGIGAAAMVVIHRRDA